MGALGDSFFEYLLKAWLQSNKEDNEARQMFDDAMQAVFQHMLRKSVGGLTYFAELKFDRPEEKMDHLSCFAGGLLALGAKTLKNEQSERYMQVMIFAKRNENGLIYWYYIYIGSGRNNEHVPRIIR